jgi:hypothetical protein
MNQIQYLAREDRVPVFVDKDGSRVRATTESIRVYIGSCEIASRRIFEDFVVELGVGFQGIAVLLCLIALAIENILLQQKRILFQEGTGFRSRHQKCSILS